MSTEESWYKGSFEVVVKEIIANELGVDPEKVTPEASFEEDLGAGFTGVRELVRAFEREFSIDIPDEDGKEMATVGEAIRYLQSNLAAVALQADDLVQKMSDSAPDQPQSSVLSCSECGHENPAEVNFCTRCGAKMTLQCKKCGFKSPQGSEFCGSCGEETEFRVEKMARNAALAAEEAVVEAMARGALIPCKTYYPNGRLAEKGFKKPDLADLHDERPTVEDEWDGPLERYHPNGQLQEKGTFTAGELDGPYEVYYENGQLELKYTYVAGELNGPFESYVENGQLFVKATYVAGEKDGPYESYSFASYYANGQLYEKGTYNVSEKCGEWFEDGETVTYDPCPPSGN